MRRTYNLNKNNLVLKKPTKHKYLTTDKIMTRLYNKTAAQAAGAQLYGRSRQCGRPVEARCSMRLGRNPLINGLIQHTLKLNILLVEKFTAIHFY